MEVPDSHPLGYFHGGAAIRSPQFPPYNPRIFFLPFTKELHDWIATSKMAQKLLKSSTMLGISCTLIPFLNRFNKTY